jgi:hypothetical protein
METNMRKIMLVLMCLMGAVIGFFGTLFIIDGGIRSPFGNADARSPREALVTFNADPNKFGGSDKAALRQLQGGVEVKSTFEKSAAAGAGIDGAAYMHVEGRQLPVIAGRKITLELDATADGDAVGQSTEFQYVQNGLGQSGWKRFLVKAGRQTYRFDYAAPADNRPPSKIDTFWVRSDADGQGRPLVVHAMRIYAE